MLHVKPINLTPNFEWQCVSLKLKKNNNQLLQQLGSLYPLNTVYEGDLFLCRGQQATYEQPTYQISQSQQFYQPASSNVSYERLSPNSYREIPTDNEPISYSNLQQPEGSQLITSVDSSTLTQMVNSSRLQDNFTFTLVGLEG